MKVSVIGGGLSGLRCASACTAARCRKVHGIRIVVVNGMARNFGKSLS